MAAPDAAHVPVVVHGEANRDLSLELAYTRTYTHAGARGPAAHTTVSTAIPEIAYYSLVCRYALGDADLASQLRALAVQERKEPFSFEETRANLRKARALVSKNAWSARHAAHADEAKACEACSLARGAIPDGKSGKTWLGRYYSACIMAWETPVYTGTHPAHIGLVAEGVEPRAGPNGRAAIAERVTRASDLDATKVSELQGEILLMVDTVCARMVAFYEARLVGRLETGLVTPVADGVVVHDNDPRMQRAAGAAGHVRADLVPAAWADHVVCATVCMADVLADRFGLMPSVLLNQDPPRAYTEPDGPGARAAVLCDTYPRRICYTTPLDMESAIMNVAADPARARDDNYPKENALGRIAEWLRAVACATRRGLAPGRPVHVNDTGRLAVYRRRPRDVPPAEPDLATLLATARLDPVPVRDVLGRRKLLHAGADARPRPDARAGRTRGIPDLSEDPRTVRLVPSLWPVPDYARGRARHDPCSIPRVAAAQ